MSERHDVGFRGLAAGAGLLAWIGVLCGLLRLLDSGHAPAVPVPATLPVEVFEDVAPPTPVQVPTPAARAPSPEATRPQPSVPARSAPPKPTLEPKTAPAPRPSQPAIPVPQSVPPQAPVAPTAPAVTPTPAAPPSPAPDAAAQQAAAKTSDTPSSAHDSDKNPSPSSASSNGNAASGPAHATYQPLPDIPDEDRAEAYAAVALARFAVHPDGSADVSLLKATNNPTLNRLLLASLRKWRFAPATQDGQPIETSIDLRVHFNVQ